MKRRERFTFLVTPEERTRIDTLSRQLEGTRSEVIRILLNAGYDAIVKNPSLAKVKSETDASAVR